jgi:NCAIR mutase (PurE)-related protein
MDPTLVRRLLESVGRGDIGVDEALAELRDLPFAELEFATVDHHRALRTGYPEVILGAGKTAEQIIDLFREIDRHDQDVLATRVSSQQAKQLVEAIPEVEYDSLSRTAVLMRSVPQEIGGAPIAIVSAGTSDLPVAEEAAITATVLGNRVERIYDVGVAGIHRLLPHRKKLNEAVAIIVVAGMEGALPSVIGGMVSKPVIGVPTSVGYGANLGGITALLGMLTSCASGVTVVNIDNGFGAAMAASQISRAVAQD